MGFTMERAFESAGNSLAITGKKMIFSKFHLRVPIVAKCRILSQPSNLVFRLHLFPTKIFLYPRVLFLFFCNLVLKSTGMVP